MLGCGHLGLHKKCHSTIYEQNYQKSEKIYIQICREITWNPAANRTTWGDFCASLAPLKMTIRAVSVGVSLPEKTICAQIRPVFADITANTDGAMSNVYDLWGPWPPPPLKIKIRDITLLLLHLLLPLLHLLFPFSCPCPTISWIGKTRWEFALLLECI